MNNEQLASGKIVDPCVNLDDFRAPKKSTIEKTSRLATIPIYENFLDFILNN